MRGGDYDKVLQLTFWGMARRQLVSVVSAALALIALSCAKGDGRSGEAREEATPQTPARAERGAHLVEPLRTFAYDCDDGSYIVARFNEAADTAVVFLQHETAWLPQVPAASGAKYSDGAITLWTKGNEATLERAEGLICHCTEDRRRSRIEDSKLRGNDFWATGNEPGWTLEIGWAATVLVTDYGQRRIEFATPEPVVEAEGARARYTVEIDGQRVEIEITAKPCRDSMSGQPYESTVVVRLGDKLLRGCGLALH